jgi:ribosomal protein S12 methylthiotransferase accessory factor
MPSKRHKIDEKSSRALEEVLNNFPFVPGIPAWAIEAVPVDDVIDKLKSRGSYPAHHIIGFLSAMLERLLGSRLYIHLDKKDILLPDRIRKITSYLKQHRILKAIQQSNAFTDIPQIPLFTATLEDHHCENISAITHLGGSGASLKKERAMWKALCESMERYCAVFGIEEKPMIKASYRAIERKAINPKEIVSFSEEQKELEWYQKSRYDDDTVFSWAAGFSFDTGKEIFLPAQVLSLRGTYQNEEKIIRLPISTGQAGDFSLEGAIYAGLCEAIERDAFMIYWLNRLTPRIIDTTGIADEEIQALLRAYQRYYFDVHILDITTDIQVPTVLAVVIDKTGNGPAVSVAAKTDLDFLRAVKGALEEVFQILSVGRYLMVTRPGYYDRSINEPNPLLVVPYNLSTAIEDRILLWSYPQMITRIKFFINGEKKKIDTANSIDDLSAKEKLAKVVVELQKRNLSSYYIETTTKIIKATGFRAVSTLVPGLQPLYLNEHFPYLGGERLRSVPQRLGYHRASNFNTDPHPFG